MGPDTTLMWTGGDVVRIGPEGDVESLVSRPFQQVLRLLVIPLGSWRADTASQAMYIRADRIESGVPAHSRQRAKEA